MRRGLCAGVAALALAACSPRAVQQSEPLRLTADVLPLSVGNEAREAIVLRDGRRSVSLPVKLPAAAELSFGYAVSGRSGQADAAHAGQLMPVTLELALLRSGGERVSLFERRLDPQQPHDRRWADASADLSAWQGEAAVLEFSIRPEPDGATPLVGVWEPTLHSAGARSARPNLLVISIDTLRARNVGAYGYPRATTPFLDELARSGALFENAITASVTTGPSHMSLFTGLYPVHHGMRIGVETRRADASPLAQLLREAGYHCAAFTEDGYIIRGLGFGDGFSEYTENTRPPTPRGEDVPGDARLTFEQAKRWVARSRRQPFFLFVHTYQVHSPFAAPPETAQLFRDGDAPGTASEPLRVLLDEYDREIRFVDDKIRELVAALDAHGLRESTLILVTSDHGEEFGEHGSFQHGTALFEESLRVPLILAGPGIPAGRRIAEQVSLIDVAPTLLGVAGVAPPPNLDGSSLLPSLRGAPMPPRTLFAEATANLRWRMPYQNEPFHPPLIAARAGDAKVLVHRPKEGEAAPTLHYNLSGDAGEQAPRALEGEERAMAESLVDAYLRGRGDAAPSPAAEPLDPELRRRLEALGYSVPSAPAP